MSKIELKNVSYRYMSSADNGQENSVDSVTLTINEGEAVAFIGTSGCGKTTLTRLINGLAFSFFKIYKAKKYTKSAKKSDRYFKIRKVNFSLRW